MEIKDILFQSLLNQQGISHFKPILIDRNSISHTMSGNQVIINNKHYDLNNLYGYIKDSLFHICDVNFNEIKLGDLKLKELGIHQIGESRDSYIYPNSECESSIIINDDGRILFNNQKNFYYIGENLFLLDMPIYINNYDDGVVYDVLKNIYISPINEISYPVDSENYKEIIIKIPPLENKVLIINGKQNDRYQYLFTLKNDNSKTSYILDKQFYKILVYDSFSKNEIKFNYIWYVNGKIYIISLNPLRKNLDCGQKTDNENLEPIHIEIKVNGGHSFNCDSSSILNIETDYDTWKEYLLKEIHISPTRNALFIYFEYKCYYYIIVIRDNGSITFCDKIQGSSIKITENNLIRVGWWEYGSQYLDIKGKKIGGLQKYHAYEVFKRAINKPTRFNSDEITLQRNNLSKYHNNFSELDAKEYDCYEGIINIETGKVLIPPCFTRIQSRICENTFFNTSEKEFEQSKFISIVQIDNYFNGNISSYFGLYCESKLVIPIGYSKIEFLSFKRPIKLQNTNLVYENVYTNFILIQQDSLLGLADIWGNIIINPCADSYRILEKSEQYNYKIRNDNLIGFLHTPKVGSPEYITLCKNNLYNLIYRNKIISDFIYTKLEIESVRSDFFYDSENDYESFDKELIFIKASIENKVRLIYKGQLLTDFYTDIKPYNSLFLNQRKENTFVVVVFDEKGNQGLLDNKGNIIIEISNNDIQPYKNFIICNSTFLDKNNKEIFRNEGYTLVKEISQPNNEHMFCYRQKDTYVIIYGDGKVYQFNKNDNIKDKIFDLGDDCYNFDLNKECFTRIDDEPDDSYYSDDSPDWGDDELDYIRNNGGDWIDD